MNGPAATASQNEPATHGAYRVLERMIITLDLPPGSTTSEAELMRQTGLGRTPVREAVQRLAWEGFIDIRPRAGLVIAPLHASDWLKVVDARRCVESVLARAATRYTSRATVAHFHDVALSMRKAAITGNVLAFLDADKQFDEILATAADNAFATRVASPLQTHSRRFWFRFKSESGLTEAAEHHVRLIHAIVEGDEDNAARQSDTLMDLIRAHAVAVVTR